MMNLPPRRTLAVCLTALVVVVGTVGCERQLMRAPIMFDQTRADPFDELPEDQRHPRATIFFATNRKADVGNQAEPYGRARARALVLGKLQARLGDGLQWDELIEKTLGPLESRRPTLHLDPPEEFGPLLTTAPPRKIGRVSCRERVCKIVGGGGGGG
ncbi:MAG: hypothetical protein AAGL98_04845, partial [Planctomycetota bacterium]